MANERYAPRGYGCVTPYFTVRDAKAMIEFLKAAFDAEPLHVSEDGGTDRHAEARVGGTIVELSTGSDRFPPRTNTIHLFVADADATYRRALEAGASTVYEPADMPYGERSAGVEDPFGNHWYIATFAGGPERGYYD